MKRFFDNELVQILMVVVLAFSLVYVALVPCLYLSNCGKVVLYHATLRTMKAARYNVETNEVNESAMIENAALTLKIVEINQWIAKAQYYNGKWYLDLFYPDSVENLKPLE